MKVYKLLFKKRHPQDKVIEYLKKRGYKVTRANEVMLIIYKPLYRKEIWAIERIVNHYCKHYRHKGVYDFSFKEPSLEKMLEENGWVRIL